MKSIIMKINHVIRGDSLPEDPFYFYVAEYACAIVHLLLLIAFSYMKCELLIVVDTLALVYYLVYIRYLIKKKRYAMAYYSIYIAIFLHDILCCFVLGWNFGFSLYNLALIPVSYYMLYMTDGIRRKLSVATLMAFFNVLITTIARLYVYVYGGIHHYDPFMAFVIAASNMLISCLMVMIFSVFYIANIRTSERKLYHLANFDALTEIHNRYSMMEFLNVRMKEHACYTIAICDIDDFKSINDTYGHCCGDMILKEIATIVKENIRKQDSVCRWGGEELLIFFPSNAEETYEELENIRRLIANKIFLYEGQRINVTMTFGLQEGGKGEKLEKIIHMADARMYYGKRNGKNQVVKKMKNDSTGLHKAL